KEKILACKHGVDPMFLFFSPKIAAFPPLTWGLGQTIQLGQAVLRALQNAPQPGGCENAKGGEL
ncbi:MAG: hypothetical protein WAQ41_09465, partial [bacterium]